MMNDSLVIGLDSSTTGTKAFAFNSKGKIIAKASEPISLSSPQPNYYEQNSEDWWKSAQKVLKNITRQVKANRIKAISISNQRETFVPLDKDYKSLRPAIIWLDERCKSEVDSFSKKIGKNKIHKITGKPVDFAPCVYRLAWMKKYEKNNFNKIAMICDVQSWLVWKLTNQFKTSWASADPLGLFDMKNKTWSKLILDGLDLTENQLPQVYPSGTVLGKISKDTSKLTGLSIDTMVIAGGGDGQAAGLGANALLTKRAYLNLGTAAVAGVYGSKYMTSKSFRTMSACADSGYYYECSLRAGTFAIDWFIKNILDIDPLKQPNIYSQLEKEAKLIKTGSDNLFFLPYLSGAMNPYWDINARAVFIGLSSSHTKGHMYRAILEGIAFEQLFAINLVEKSINEKVKELVAIGGGAKSNFWCQIIADITGKNICILENPEASGLGAGIAAAVGFGWYSSFSQASEKMTSIKNIIKPNLQNHKFYLKQFLSYKKIYPAFKNNST
ncbi:MAG: xylulose kinase [Ignavibacteriae bacterium]|nr:xylulose kinase [Ignavibacteriota bacterium]